MTRGGIVGPTCSALFFLITLNILTELEIATLSISFSWQLQTQDVFFVSNFVSVSSTLLE